MPLFSVDRTAVVIPAGTIPVVLAIGFITHKTIFLGLNAANTVLLLLTLVVSMLTFALERTMSHWERCTCFCFSLI